MDTVSFNQELPTVFQVKLDVDKLDGQQSLDSLLVNRINKTEMSQIPFLLLGLLCENVALVSVFSLDLSRSGKRETLF